MSAGPMHLAEREAGFVAQLGERLIAQDAGGDRGRGDGVEEIVRAEICVPVGSCRLMSIAGCTTRVLRSRQ